MSQETKEKCKETQHKNWPLWAIVLTSVVTVISVLFLAYIVLTGATEDKLEFSLSDWVGIVLPVVGAALVVIFAFLGVDRLKNFDERQDKLSNKLHSDLHTEIDNAVKLVKPDLDKIYNEWECNLKTKLGSYDQALSAINQRIQEYNQMIGSIQNIENIIDTVGNIAEATEFISTSLFPQEQVDKDSNSTNSTDSSAIHPDITQKTQRTRTLAAIIKRIQDGIISGESDDYHNLSVTLANLNYFDYAADIVKKGLERFPDGIDLLSDYIHYSHKSGRQEDTNDGMIRLDQLKRNIWNWRAFTFYIDVINDGEATPENKQKALHCVSDYKRVLPNEERAYMAEYETYLKYGELKLAEDALIEAEKTCTMTAQCSLALSKIYHMRGDFDLAIKSASRAVLGQTERQPSSDTGAAFAQRAFSRDAKVHLNILNSKDQVSSIVEQCDDISMAIKDYIMALKFGYRASNIHVRINILGQLLPDKE